MTKYANKSFSVSCASGGVSDEELARRWEETFGKKKPKAQDEAKGEAEAAPATSEEPTDAPPEKPRAKKRKA